MSKFKVGDIVRRKQKFQQWNSTWKRDFPGDVPLNSKVVEMDRRGFLRLEIKGVSYGNFFRC